MNDFENESIPADGELAKKINKAALKLIKEINKPKKFSLNKCFEECIESDDFRPFHYYLKSKIDEFGIIDFFDKIHISPIKVMKQLDSKRGMKVTLLFQILKVLNLKLFIRKNG